MKLPDNLDPDLATFTRMATIAMTSLRQSNIELGDYVLVSGLGLVGNFAAQLAQLQGAKVIAADIDESRLEIAKNCGIKKVVNASAKDYEKQIINMTKGKKVSTYIDATGLSNVISDNLSLVADNGEAILGGSPRAEYQTNVTDVFNHEHLRGVKLKGALEWLYPTQPSGFVKHSQARNTEIVMELISEGELQVKPMYTHKMKPEDASKAYNGLKNKPEDYLGVVFNWK